MTCVGIVVSKGKSTVAAMRPFGEVVLAPFDVNHRAGELDELLSRLREIDGEVRVVIREGGPDFLQQALLQLRHLCHSLSEPER